MPIYKAPLRDMQFTLNEVLEANAFWQNTPKLSHVDGDTVKFNSSTAGH